MASLFKANIGALLGGGGCSRLSLILAAPLLLGACASSLAERKVGSVVSCRPSAPCPSGWQTYENQICTPPGGRCAPAGDNLCYLPCDTDADCRAVGLDSCGTIPH